MTLPPRNYLAKRGRDTGIRSQAHRRFVKMHLCAIWHLGGCSGPIDCCHARDYYRRGAGKPPDFLTYSACRKHHAEAEKNERA